MNSLDYQTPVLRSVSGAKAAAIIAIASASVLAFLFWLLYFKPASHVASSLIPVLPAVNACFNAASALLLIGAYVAIRNRKIALHMQLIFAALGSSTCFFISYVVYHSFHGDTKFAGVGGIRPIYFLILISHILLSAIVVPMVLTTLYLALSGKFLIHRRLARFTFPVWLYFSATGVAIFVMLKLYNG
jgi:putative membrane protein